jgi:hypothetical protein
MAIVSDGEHLYVPHFQDQLDWYNSYKSKGFAYLLITADYFFHCEYGRVAVEKRGLVFDDIAQVHKPENDYTVVESISLNDDFALQLTNKLMCDSETNEEKQAAFESFGDVLKQSGYQEDFSGLHYIPSMHDLYGWYEKGMLDKRKFLLIVEHRTPESRFFPFYVSEDRNLFSVIRALQGKHDCFVTEVYNTRFDFLHQWKAKSLSIYEPDAGFHERRDKSDEQT